MHAMRISKAPLAVAIAAVAVLSLSLGMVSSAKAQDAGAKSDNDLDRLLEQAEKKDAPASAPALKPDDAKKVGPSSAVAGKKADEPKKGEVSAQDEGVDDLLRKLGEAENEPETKSARPAPGRPEPKPQDPMRKPGEDSAKGDALDPGQKEVDERLEEILGRFKKNKGQDQGKDPESGQLAEAIKQMREVQKKLNEPDTGEQTQAKQKEILKKLEVAMRQARQSGSARGQRRPGQQRPGQQGPPQQDPNPDQNPDGQGVGAGKPDKPKPKSELVNRKDIWGHLPDALRNEMNNISRETMLEARKSLIERYYLSVAKKGRTGQGE